MVTLIRGATFGDRGMILGVVFVERGLIIGVVFVARDLIKSGDLWWEGHDNRGRLC